MKDFQQSVKYYGWRPDKPDPRDSDHAFKRRRMMRLPPNATMRTDFLPPVWDQGNLGICTGYAGGSAVAFLRACKGEKFFTPSARFLYYNTRVIEGTVKDDAGAELRNMVKAVVDKGICSSYWCSNDNKLFTRRPGALAYFNAFGDVITAYQRIYNDTRLEDVKSCVVENIPVVFGFSVFEHFESDDIWKGDSRGMMKKPATGEKLVGGHAVWVLGYDDKKKIHDQEGGVLCRNSWGQDWGLDGNFWMPYSLFADPDFAEDFWALRAVR